MKIVPPTLRERVLEEWHQESINEHQLAERFNLTWDLDSEIIEEAETTQRRPINRQVLSMARELYDVMPTEIAGSFAARFENIFSIRSGLLAVPSL